MFTVTLGTSGYLWTCTTGKCKRGGIKPNAAEAAEAAIEHRDGDHPEMVWSVNREKAATRVVAWLSAQEGADYLNVSPVAVMDLVNQVAEALGHRREDPRTAAVQRAVEHWGRDPLTVDTMHDPRLIEVPEHSGPTRNWTTNHAVRWSVGESIQMPPDGKGCKARGARVGEDVEVCSLPLHDAANVKHVFAIGERVTRIAHN